jgi:hypothetical protein
VALFFAILLLWGLMFVAFMAALFVVPYWIAGLLTTWTSITMWVTLPTVYLVLLVTGVIKLNLKIS